MDEKSMNPKKPLRVGTFNKAKDILNTYGKQQPAQSSAEQESSNREQTRLDSQKELEENFKNALEEEKMQIEQELQKQFDERTVEFENEIARLQEITTQLETEKEKFKEQLLHKAAELENFRNRTFREKQELIEYANERLLFKMLELLDGISAAAEAGKKSSDYGALLKGIDLIYQKAVKIFEESGVKRMENPVGQDFNVDFHEALMAQPSDLPEGKIVQEIAPGYFLHDKPLRYARVITSAASQ